MSGVMSINLGARKWSLKLQYGQELFVFDLSQLFEIFYIIYNKSSRNCI